MADSVAVTPCQFYGQTLPYGLPTYLIELNGTTGIGLSSHPPVLLSASGKKEAFFPSMKEAKSYVVERAPSSFTLSSHGARAFTKGAQDF